MKSTLTANGKELISWAWINEPDYEDSGFACPKCSEQDVNKEQPKYCRCEDLPKGHFHFVCTACSFDAIMRTHDDRENSNDDDTENDEG